MRVLAASLLAAACRVLLRLRYRVRLVGLDAAGPRRGVLILPNHPGELDPVIVITTLWGRFRARPMVIEDFYHLPALNWLFRLIGAIPMPNMEGGASHYKRMRVSQALAHAAASLQAGENVLIYPAGRLMRSGLEALGGNSGIEEILRRVPETPVLLVRTRGLLGSSFSWVAQRHRPDLAACLLRGAKYLLLNLGFFMPRRPVTATCAWAPADFPRADDRVAINRWLEEWYNQDGEEPLSLISYSRWSEVRLVTAGAPGAAPAAAALPPVDVPPAVRSKVYAELARAASFPVADLRDELELSRDLGLDSLAAADLVTWLDEQFQVMDVQPEDLVRVRDVLLASAEGASYAKHHENVPLRVPARWSAGANSRPPLSPPDPARPIQYNVLRNCDRLAALPAIADEVSGVLTYRQVKLRALLLAGVFRRWPEERIGVLLPAGVAADVVVLGVLLAGKVPVMLNWTLGDANLQHVLALGGVKRIVSAGRFLDRLQTVNFELLRDYLVVLEDLRATAFGLRAKLLAWWQARQPPDVLARTFGFDHVKVDDAAVILFTSGSEAAPKGVPLTHRNLQANVSGGLAAGVFRPEDAFMGFLPPFHSFGFTVATILPLISGLRTVYYPNPTDSRKLASGIGAWRPTIVCGTPTFMAGILKAAAPGQVASLRVVLCGAEKLPAELRAALHAAGVQEVLEGYGITETAPVLTLNPPGQPPVGVGRPLGDVRLLIVDPETKAPLPVGQRGLILASGDNVFGGYLGRDSRDAFVASDGRRWYITGDLGVLDEVGNLTLAGRLKRFIKVGGEMISLPAMEEAIQQAYPHTDGLVRSALAYLDRPGQRPLLCLYTTFAAECDAINDVLRRAGFSSLARVNQVTQLPEIPVLGTGKTDYRRLTELLKTAAATGS